MQESRDHPELHRPSIQSTGGVFSTIPSSSEHEASNADPLHQELFPRRLRDEEGNRKDRSGSTNIRPTTDPTNSRHGKKERQIGKEKNPYRKIRAIGEKKRISATVGRPFKCLTPIHTCFTLQHTQFSHSHLFTLKLKSKGLHPFFALSQRYSHSYLSH